MTDILNDLDWLKDEMIEEGENLHSREIEIVVDALAEITRLRAMIDQQNTSREGLVTTSVAEIARLNATIDQFRSVAGAVSIESELTFSGIKKDLQATKDNG